MKPCISQATTLSTPFEQDLTSYSRAGWTAVELWLTKLETYLEGHSLADVKAQLLSQGLTAAAASVQGGLLLSRGVEREVHLEHYQKRLAMLQELGVPTLIVAADFNRELSQDDYGRAAGALAEAAEIAQRFGVRLALEFQKSAKFCASLDTTVALIMQSGASGVGVCLDLFHYYTGPSKFEDLAYLTPEILAWVQLCDVAGTPRELATDSDRIFPGEGDFQTEPWLDQIGHIGYDGYVSLEVLNPHLWQIPADRVADLGYQSLSRALGKWNTPDARLTGAGGTSSEGGL